MIKKLICWIWGHKTIHKAVTGNKITTTNQFTGQDQISLLYKYERTPFCTRCGKPSEKV